MNKNTLEQSLIDALAYCSVRELPPEDDKQNVYIGAIALVTKRDGSKSYCVLQKDKNCNDKIIKDFGSISPIVSIEKIYPYLYLNSNFVPKFDSKKREERVKWLSIVNPNENYEEMSMRDLNKAIINIAIQNQLKAIKTQQGYE